MRGPAVEIAGEFSVPAARPLSATTIAAGLRAATPGGTAVELRGVTKRYGSVIAVAELDLDIAAGSFVTLLGPSGSGKSTVLQVIAGLIEPSAGSVRIGGRTADGLPANRRNVGFVFQQYALFPHLTVAQNLAFPLEMRRLPRHETSRRVGEALEQVGLSGLERRRPRELSGGQQQRVALARALIYRPQVVLMDEPLGALDRNLRQQMQVEIKRIQAEQGVTILYVTHDQSEAMAMSDQIVVLRAGRLAQAGTPQALYERPESEFVATFVGEANLFAARVSTTDSAAGFARAVGAWGLGALARHDGLQPGTAVTIVVRPEDLRVADPPAGDGPRATVQAVTFTGEVHRIQLVGPDGRVLLAKVAKDGRVPPPVGSTVGIGWREDSATFVAA